MRSLEERVAALEAARTFCIPDGLLDVKFFDGPTGITCEVHRVGGRSSMGFYPYAYNARAEALRLALVAAANS